METPNGTAPDPQTFWQGQVAQWQDSGLTQGERSRKYSLFKRKRAAKPH